MLRELLGAPFAMAGELIDGIKRVRATLKQLGDALEQDALDAYNAATMGCRSNAELDEQLAGEPE